jgi:hypothetical protein
MRASNAQMSACARQKALADADLLVNSLLSQ